MGSIHDIKHVVILMQENRSFDEYFGTFPGASGFSDPVELFENQYFDTTGAEIKPFRMSTFTTSGLQADYCIHNWNAFQKFYNNGQPGQGLWSYPFAADVGGTNNPGVMAYYVANDIPFHWWLASTFALCDQYYCSTLGGTDPNRIFLMSGEIGVGAGATIVNNGAGYNAPTWPNYADMLTSANVSWKIYDHLTGDNLL